MRWVLLLVLQKLDMRVQLQMGRWPHEHKRNTGVCDPVDRECSDCACVSAGWNFLYVPACDLKREQGEEIQYDNRRAFFIRFIVMVLCPVVGPAFFLCSYLIYKTVFRQAVDLEDVIFSKERVQTHLKADEERERNMAPLEESLAVSDKRNMRMLMLNVIRGDMQKYPGIHYHGTEQRRF